MRSGIDLLELHLFGTMVRASIAVAVVATTVYSFAGKKVCWLFYFLHSSGYYFVFMSL